LPGRGQTQTAKALTFPIAGGGLRGDSTPVKSVAQMEFPNSEIQLAWPPPPHFQQLGDEVHVWSARLFCPGQDDDARLGTLSQEERQRAGMFHGERDRRDFIARRFLLRVILGRYLKMEPWQVSLVCEERGKPRLSGAENPPPLHFNLSHSGHLALVAVGRHWPMGVDVERIRPMPEMDGIAGAFFSMQENARLAAVGPEEKGEVFFSIWTRKEAFLKATGEGIAGELGRMDCAQAPPGWSLHSLSPAPGFVGALAARGAAAAPLCWRWCD
jgi:4'-phosphopantetheinyl transferase